MISILTTVYNNDKFIKEALDSFIESCGDIEYEILVGIDKCELSLNNLLQLYPNLNKNIKLFYFTDKVGTYVIRNTLAKNAKFNNLIFFDSDDVMRKNTVSHTLSSLQSGYDFFRFGYISFSGKLKLPKDQPIKQSFTHHYGAFGIKKNVFLEMNGFEPWICAADGEFFWRIQSNNYNVLNSQEINILYRRHDNNLTSGSSTGMKSPLRKEYHKIKDYKIKNNIKKPLSYLSISSYKLIDESFYSEYIKYGLEKTNLYKKEISIIIPTYNTPKYLSECLNSVSQSIKSVNCEVLVGVDNCEHTKQFIKNNDFDYRIRFFYFNKNVGPYVIKNTLSEISNSNTLLFFDSDDIMNEGMISEILSQQSKNDFVKPMYLDFDNDKENISYEIKTSKTYGEGVFSIRKNLFLEMNGFEGWRCAADSDFMTRLYKNNKKFSYTNNVTFYRRIHPNNLTTNPETNFNSKLRAHYFKISKEKTYFGPLPELVIEQYDEIYPKKYVYGYDVNNYQPILTDTKNEMLSKLTLRRQTLKTFVQEIPTGNINKKEYKVIDNTPVLNEIINRRQINSTSNKEQIINIQPQKATINQKRNELYNHTQKITPDGFKKKNKMNNKGGKFNI